MTVEPNQKKQKTQRKPLVLNFFEALTPVLHAPGQWKNPRDESRGYTKAEYWIKLAQLAERGKIHGLFLGDALAIYGGYKGPYNFSEAAKTGNNFPKNDPTAYLSAIAVSTKNVSVGITCSTLSEHPYHFARRMATMDHISGGRVGWNIVSSQLPSAGRQLADNNEMPEKELRYEKSDEYLEVFYKLLLSSWRDDGVVFDRENGIFSNPDAIREINHDGKWFKVPGPQITEPTEGRIPLLIQAGSSEKGKLLGAKHAEVIFMPFFTPELARSQIAETKKLSKEKYGRNPDNIKFITMARILVGKDHEDAERKKKEYDSYYDPEGALVQLGGLGVDVSVYGEDEDLTKRDDLPDALAGIIKGYSKKYPGEAITRRLIGERMYDNHFLWGSAEEVADKLEEIVDQTGFDGFNLTNLVFPETFTDIVDYLIPELQKRGLAQKEYAVEGGSFRQQVFGPDAAEDSKFVAEDHYAHGLRWKKGESKEQFEQRLAQLEKKHNGFKIYADKD
ncbi:hypothetical protein WICPIJ_007944 [Wickerhamomyces pijperi]|uniref:Luciferase-like domain-containing protein n=1 Tax=Wickerhamomyces pijperi TaxID=599730 RepID=A0A9P8Q1F9_WICPI|nr:hypothetical protein WICPIJ_007944 [Wickerhamomyces pijperi]